MRRDDEDVAMMGAVINWRRWSSEEDGGRNKKHHVLKEASTQSAE